MGTFCIFFVDRAGHSVVVDEIEAASEQEAIDQVHRRYDCGPGIGYEIWQDNRRVYAHFESRLSHR